jgi:hypothetical protein
MNQNIEKLCLQVLKDAPFTENNEPSDPDICSWNQKKYPELKPLKISEKTDSAPRRSPNPCIKEAKPLNVESHFQSPSQSPVVSKTPTAISSLKRNFYIKKLAVHKFSKDFSIPASPEPRLHRLDLLERAKPATKSIYLNNSAFKKLKFKKILKEKPYQYSFNFTNSKIIEYIGKIKSPCLDVKRTHTLVNKLPLSNAQTLEELLDLTKLIKNNRKYLKN